MVEVAVVVSGLLVHSSTRLALFTGLKPSTTFGLRAAYAPQLPALFPT